MAVVANGYLVSELIGSSFFNDEDEEIGSLGDIVIDQKKAFRKLQIGRFLGLGGCLVAVPYDSLKIDDTGERIEMPDASKEEISKLAPDLRKSRHESFHFCPKDVRPDRPVSTSGLLARSSNRQADVFTDLRELQSKLGRDPSEEEDV